MAALDLRIDLDYARQWLDGRATITIENWTGSDADVVPLEVGRLMKIDFVLAEDGRALPFEQSITVYSDWTLRQVNAARVRMPASVTPRSTVRITVKYAGHLVGAAETGMLYVRERLDPAFTVLRSESFAFPQIGEPSNEAQRGVPRRDFTFSARITVPDSLVVASGGEVLERQVANGRATYVIRSRHPVPFLNLPIAPYRVFERGGIRAYVLPADSAHGEELFGVIDRALAWFTTRYGELPRAPAFSVMEIPDGYGSQADLAAGIMITAAALQRVENRRELYHEISHLWNARDAEMPSPRWNEGLATYFEYRVAADLDGGDYAGTMSSYGTWLCQRARANEKVTSTALAQYGERDMAGWSYTVGALLFHALDTTLGRATFDRAYRTLYQGTKHGTVSLGDLERAFVSADRRAKPIFADWVHTTRWYGLLCETS
jgi:aminopeptidase N